MGDEFLNILALLPVEIEDNFLLGGFGWLGFRVAEVHADFDRRTVVRDVTGPPRTWCGAQGIVRPDPQVRYLLRHVRRQRRQGCKKNSTPDSRNECLDPPTVAETYEKRKSRRSGHI